MSDCTLELQSALLSALKNDAALVADLGGQKIYDHVPSRANFPYVVFGEMNTQDWSTSSDKGVEYLFDIHIWSKYRGRSEAYKLESHIKRILDDQALNLNSQDLRNLQWQFSQIERDEEARAYLSISRFRAVVEV